MTVYTSIFLGNYYIKIFSEMNIVRLKKGIFSINIPKKKKDVIYRN
jgi:ssDNA-specific exonuclease RecJ